ncbi:unnamed protein product, partial [Allacma fusca]
IYQNCISFRTTMNSCTKRPGNLPNILEVACLIDAGGWEDQTELLVLSGEVPKSVEYIPKLLQFLGTGGRLFAWGCESLPFGPTESNAMEVENGDSATEKKRSVLKYGSLHTNPISVMKTLWGPGKASDLPSGFPGILETTGSKGNSTASVYATVKETNEIAIINYNGGDHGGRAVLSRVCFEDSKDEESSLALLTNLLSESLGIDCTRSKAPEFTVGYLLGDDDNIKNFLADISPVIQHSNLTIEFVPAGIEGSRPRVDRFPVKSLGNPATFSAGDYFNNLTTKDLGRLMIYTDLITSTMHVFEDHSLKHGLVVVANRQTQGKGRGNNVWLSPEICACFTVQVNVALDSQLGKRLPLVQLNAAMSMVLAIPNHQEIDLRMKWPNDIYIRGQKVGGVLVKSRLQGNIAIVSIGIGVNVSNKYLAVCLNSFLGEENKLTQATLVAKCLSQMEDLLEQIEKGGLNEIINTYTENWLKAGQENTDGVVRVEVSKENYVECRVEGIDESGFLRVVDINPGKVLFLHPDGYSFDIAKRLIAIKT